MDFNKASQMGKKMQKGSFDFNDFLAQSQSVRKLGGMGGMLKLIPGEPCRQPASRFLLLL